MRRTSFWIAVLVAVAVMGAAGPARADREDEAQQLFESATALFQKGEYARAADRFMHAFKLVPHGNTAFNAAQSWDAAGEHARAAEAFQMALDRGLERKAREQAEQRLDELQQELGRVRVKAPDGAKVLVGDERRDAPALLYLEPGVHDIVVVLADGSRRVRRIHARAGGTAHVAIEADAAKEDESAPNVARSVGWGAVIAAGVLGVASSVLEIRANTLRQDFNTSARTDASEREKVLRAQTWATVGWVATGVVGVTGVALVLGSKDGPQTEVSVVPGGVSVSRSF